jgi:hypothetical protein
MIYDQELSESPDLPAIIPRLKNENYWIFISVSGSCNRFEAPFSVLLDSLAIPENGKDGIWFATSGGPQWDSSMNNGEFFWRTPLHDFHLKRSKDKEGNYTNEIIIDNTDYTTVNNGLNIVVYDTMTEKVADSVGFDADAGYAMVRKAEEETKE